MAASAGVEIECVWKQDFDWLRVIAERLAADGQEGLPEPARLRALATDAGQFEIIQGLLQAFTPRLLPAEAWQSWFDGGMSPREAITISQFAPGRNSGKRKVADATGVYEQACERAAKAKARVEEVRRTLAAAEADLAIAEEAKLRDAAKAQGASLWLLLREISKRVDVLYSRGAVVKLIDALCGGFTLQEARALVEKAGSLPDDQLDTFDAQTFLRAKKALRVLEALDELHHSPQLAAKLRRAIVDICEGRAAERMAEEKLRSGPR